MGVCRCPQKVPPVKARPLLTPRSNRHSQMMDPPSMRSHDAPSLLPWAAASAFGPLLMQLSTPGAGDAARIIVALPDWLLRQDVILDSSLQEYVLSAPWLALGLGLLVFSTVPRLFKVLLARCISAATHCRLIVRACLQLAPTPAQHTPGLIA